MAALTQQEATMDYELGGWLWLVIDVLLVALLAAVIAFAVRSYRRRFRAETPQERSHEFDRRKHEAVRRG
jgi:hypothetical protein